jgi:hypothetical protein
MRVFSFQRQGLSEKQTPAHTSASGTRGCPAKLDKALDGFSDLDAISVKLHLAEPSEPEVSESFDLGGEAKGEEVSLGRDMPGQLKQSIIAFDNADRVVSISKTHEPNQEQIDDSVTQTSEHVTTASAVMQSDRPRRIMNAPISLSSSAQVVTNARAQRVTHVFEQIAFNAGGVFAQNG